MSAGLDGVTIFAGPNSSFSRSFRFERVDGDVDDNGHPRDYSGAEVFIQFWDKRGDATPFLTLSSTTTAVVKEEDTDSVQQVSLNMTSTNLVTLLANKNQNEVGFRWVVRPVGGQPRTAPKGQGWDGAFTVCVESYAGR